MDVWALLFGQLAIPLGWMFAGWCARGLWDRWQARQRRKAAAARFSEALRTGDMAATRIHLPRDW